jgi:outer membrane protein TolC
MKRYLLIIPLLLLLSAPLLMQGQTDSADLLDKPTLETIIQYTLKHKPVVQKSYLDERITRSQVNSRLADWYPQIGYNFQLQHSFQLQTTVFQEQIIQLGNKNTSISQFAYNQNIFNPNLAFAALTAKDVRKLASQNTINNKIDAVARVSKAFYDVLMMQQQIKVSDENIARLQRSVQDARNQYQSGIVDKTDYQRATIMLNNVNAAKRSNEETLKAKVEYLKSLMGYPVNAPLEVSYDSMQMESNAAFDAGQQVNLGTRIEYLQLQTQKQLQAGNLKYTKMAFLPSISGFAAYNFNYLNNSISDLYKTNYPNSYAGITLAIPIVQGGKRLMNIRQAKWQLEKADLDIKQLTNDINSQHAQALAAYNSSMANYNAIKDNLLLAKDVYNVIQLQYKSGVKTYLEVFIAETDLRTAQTNYFSALNQLLSSKIDLQQALGQIKY